MLGKVGQFQTGENVKYYTIDSPNNISLPLHRLLAREFGR